jgi:hypothetical protein
VPEWLGDYDCYAESVDERYYYDYFSKKVCEKVETPLDEHGLVNRHELVRRVITNTPRGHDWGDVPRDHHWQWPESQYPYINEDDCANPSVFRNLPINRTILPISFERRIHHMSIEPTPPPEEVMDIMIEYSKAASALFKTAREIIRYQRDIRAWREYVQANPYVLAKSGGSDKKTKVITRRKGRSNSRGLSMNLAKFRSVPERFRLVDTDGDPTEIVQNLGEILSRRTLNLAQAQVA